MRAVVVDASVAVKWLLPEVHSEAARRILRSRQELLAPDLIWAEVGNAVWKKCRQAEITDEEARGILQDFKRFPLHTQTSKALLSPAWAFATQFAISVYDSLYLALAVSSDCRLVTADRILYNTLQRKPVASTLLWVEHAR